MRYIFKKAILRHAGLCMRIQEELVATGGVTAPPEEYSYLLFILNMLRSDEFERLPSRSYEYCRSGK